MNLTLLDRGIFLTKPVDRLSTITIVFFLFSDSLVANALPKFPAPPVIKITAV